MRVCHNMSFRLTEREHSFITNMAEQCAEGNGSEESKCRILRTLIRLFEHLDVDLSGVRTEEQLLKRLQDAVGNK